MGMMAPAMGQISAQTLLAMPREEAWAKLRDIALARHYVSGVERIEITTPNSEGVGANRRVFVTGRPPVDETVILWEEGRGFTMKLHNDGKPPAPFKEAAFRYWLDDAPGDQTLVHTTLSYRLPLGVLGRLLDALVLRRAMTATITAIGPGMKQFYETGKSANPLAA
jgi:Polyketide cyclase / dehydrase and lipid transport